MAEVDDVYVVTNENKFLVMGEIERLGYKYNESNIIVEPEAKNTLPAIYAGVHEIAKKGTASVVVFPSDHIILKEHEFANIIVTLEELAKIRLSLLELNQMGKHWLWIHCPWC